jgi:hypothetical protein
MEFTRFGEEERQRSRKEIRERPSSIFLKVQFQGRGLLDGSPDI